MNPAHDSRTTPLDRNSPDFDQIAKTLQFFEQLGIAVFPGKYGQKGTFVSGWPRMPAHAAIARTRQEVVRRAGRLNLAARTGPTANGTIYAVIDLDNGDPDAALSGLLKRLGDAAIAVARTGPVHDDPESGRRGIHIWVAAAKGVRTGVSSAIGGDVLCLDRNGHGHLV